LGDRLWLQLSGVTGLAEVYMAVDNLAGDCTWVKVLDGVDSGNYVIDNLLEGVWYAFTMVDDSGLADLMLKARPLSTRPYYSVDLLREGSTTHVEGRTIAYRLRVSAINPVNMPAAIFLYERQPFTTYREDEPYRDVFVAVCSPGDLEEYPEGAPPDTEPKFYRLDQVDLDFRSIIAVDEAFQALNNDVKELVYALQALRDLERAELCHVWAGCGPYEYPSSSSSSLSQ